MKVGFISNYELSDKRGWSGTISYLNEIISKEYSIVPLVVEDNVFKKILKHITKERIIYSEVLLKLDAKKLQSKLNEAYEEGVRIFFAPSQSDLIAYISLPEDAKLIYLTDATFHLMVDYYWKRSKHDIRIGNKKEKLACNNADAIIVSSEWTKRDLISFYKVPENKIFVLEFGSNLPSIKKCERKLESNEIHLLLCGVDWKRKGVDKAIEVTKILNNIQSNYDFKLDIIGFNKNEINKSYPSYIHFAGKFNKNNLNELKKMQEYYMNGDIFVLPTIAECAGIVFSEASMYGLPIITHDTGGISSYVENNKTGKLLPISSTAEDFAKAILEILNNNKYQEMSNNSREKFEKNLNWNVWLEKFNLIINGISNK